MTINSEKSSTVRLAVAIPCHNEAAAISIVIDQFRIALPNAEILVLDNNSTDGTGDVARALGVRVLPVPEQGKGHVVRAAFRALAERDALLLVDGDGTYPAEAAPLLLAPVLEGMADMVVGARQPEAGAGAMSPVRGLGNLLIRMAFRLLIGPGTGDLLSGYRAFSRSFVDTVELRSEGFEIETELAIEAVLKRMRTLEVSVPYRPRIAGTESKLRAFADGRRILATILRESLHRGPTRVILVYCLVLTVAFLPFVASRTALVLWGSMILIGIFGFAAAAASIRRSSSRRQGLREGVKV